MPQEVFDYLKTQRTSVIAVRMPDDLPHAATVHFSHQDSPFKLIFTTGRTYKECELLLEGKPAPAWWRFTDYDTEPETIVSSDAPGQN